MAVVTVFLCAMLTLVSHGTGVSAEDETCKTCSNQIPIELALRLNTISDEKQLFREFIKPDVEQPIVKAGANPLMSVSFLFPDRVDGANKPSDEESIERKAVVRPKPAACVPELQVVSLRDIDDSKHIYWPECTRLEQCGGCCQHKQLSCQPTETETVNFQVSVMEYVENQMKLKTKTIVSRERHTKCRCDCIVKKEDCNERQEYRKSECRCVCMDKEAEAKCNDDPMRHWNSENCSCECLSVVECSTGTYYSQATCGCVALPNETQSEDISANQRPPPTRKWWQFNYNFGRK